MALTTKEYFETKDRVWKVYYNLINPTTKPKTQKEIVEELQRLFPSEEELDVMKGKLALSKSLSIIELAATILEHRQNEIIYKRRFIK